VRARWDIDVTPGKERRPQLAAALREARRQRCSIAVAKLDRLTMDDAVNGAVSGIFAATGKKTGASRIGDRIMPCLRDRETPRQSPHRTVVARRPFRDGERQIPFLP
jgi:hypothetical protein